MNPENIKLNKICLPTFDGFVFVNHEDMIYYKAYGKYTIAYTTNDEKPLKIKLNISKIKELASSLKTFIRCHRSHLVNVIHINNVNKKERLIQTRAGEVPISRNKVKELYDNMETIFNSL